MKNQPLARGTTLAIGGRMDMVTQLLTDIHSSIDRLAEDLSRDRPDLAAALRKEASLIPKPEVVPRQLSTPPTVTQLRPLLYRALDEGLLPHRRFDALMIRRVRAAGVLRARRCGQSR
jgi:hypothetical protein